MLLAPVSSGSDPASVFNPQYAGFDPAFLVNF